MDDLRTIRIQPPVWIPVILLLAVLIGGGFYIHGKKLETRAQTVPTISVSGEGKTSMAPDIAELRFGVQVPREMTAKIAMAKLADLMHSVIAGVKGAEVSEKDIRTESLSLNPFYDWMDGRQVQRGFDASQSLVVKVRNLDAVSDVLGAATAAGANQVGGVDFTIDDPELARAIAREKAIAQAQGKAKELAAQLGMRLGRLQGFSEGGGSMPMPYAMRGEMAMDALSKDSIAPPLPAGEQEIHVQVTLTYALR